MHSSFDHPAWADKQQTRSCKTRNSRHFWASEQYDNWYRYKNIGRHLPALFLFSDARIRGRLWLIPKSLLLII